jgi:hypothetical protein
MRSWVSSVEALLSSCLSPRNGHRKVILGGRFRNYLKIKSIPWNCRPGFGVLFAIAAVASEREAGTESYTALRHEFGADGPGSP